MTRRITIVRIFAFETPVCAKQEKQTKRFIQQELTSKKSESKEAVLNIR